MNTFRFAIMGAGNIAHKFADAARECGGTEVCAVASSSIDRARAFAEEKHIPAFYGDYAQMLDAEHPDCVYIAAVNSKHFELAKLCAEKGVNVLCEKAMFMNPEDARAFDRLAGEKGIFWMEAMWSRFLLTNVRAKQAIQEGFIGKPCFVDVDIGFKVDKDPNNRYWGAELGGGASRDITVYAYELVTWLMDSREKTSYVLSDLNEHGVDSQEFILMRLENGVPVTIKSSFVSTLDDNLTVQGTDGCIVIPHPHWATGFTVHQVKNGPATGSFKDDSGVNGFVYEIREAARCVRAGLKESPVVPHSDTLAFAEMTGRILKG